MTTSTTPGQVRGWRSWTLGRWAPVILVCLVAPGMVVAMFFQRAASGDLAAAQQLRQAERLLDRQGVALARFEMGDVSSVQTRGQIYRLRAEADRAVADSRRSHVAVDHYESIKKAQAHYRIVVDDELIAPTPLTISRTHQAFDELRFELEESAVSLTRHAQAEELYAEGAIVLGFLLWILLGLETARWHRHRRLVEMLSNQARLSAERLQAVVNGSSDLIILYDADQRAVWRNRSGEQTLAPQTLPPRGESLRDLVHPADAAPLLQWMAGRGATGPEGLVVDPDQIWTGELRLRTGLSWVEHSVTVVDRLADAAVESFVLTGHDQSAITGALSQLEHEATHDPLTGLGNRHAYVRGLQRAAAAGKRGVATTLVVLDVDRFAAVNTAMGEGTGDDVLCELASRLKARVSPSCEVFRVGNDEFAVLRVGPDAREAGYAAETFAELGRRPYETRGGPLTMTVSVGYASSVGFDNDINDLHTQAALALASARKAGGDRVSEFDTLMRSEHDRAEGLVRALRTAVGCGEIGVLYQPISDAGGRVVGAEALLRWESAQFGTVSPDEFIPLAEQSGLIAGLGTFVLRQAMTDLAHIRSLNPGHAPYMSINVSAYQLRSDDFVVEMLHALADTGVDKTQIVLEVTESAALDDDCVRSLGALHQLGVRLALDDFGTGYASLTMMLRAPFEMLKIDRSFVVDVEINSRSKEVIRAVVALARSQGIATVAEGVETVGQRDSLMTLGCDLMQGWLFGRPGSLAAFRTMLDLPAQPLRQWPAQKTHTPPTPHLPH